MRHRKRIILGIIIVVVSCLALFAVATYFAGQSARAEMLAQNPAPGELVDIGGRKIHLNCKGEGSPTVVFEAGMNEFSVQWATIQDALQATNRVCSYDRAGFGWSDVTEEPFTAERAVSDLQNVLVAANVPQPYVLVGHSFGGVNVRLFADKYPHEVMGMVLVDSAHEEQVERLPTVIGDATTELVSQFESFQQMNQLGLMALSPEQIPAPNLPATAVSQYRAILASTSFFETAVTESEAFPQYLRDAKTQNATDFGDMPIIILTRGRADPFVGVSAADNAKYEAVWQELQLDLTQLSTNTKQIIAEESGHYIHLDQPELVIEAIKEIGDLQP